MKIGDRVQLFRCKWTGSEIDDSIYTVVDVYEESVKLKHPNIGGHFIFHKDSIARTISESG